VIISTGTKTLQDQPYQRDLPLVRCAAHPDHRRPAERPGNYVATIIWRGRRRSRPRRAPISAI
jgi:Rad3-related DNA helicase